MTAAPYDPAFRRDTPLALKLKARIREHGPIDVSDFIGECLWDERDGFYATKSVLGRAGSFITSPEISQVFGELLGLWAAVVWQQMGSPPRVNLVELGPGRGTLMADALRAIQKVPAMTRAVRVTLVEASPLLRSVQQQALAGVSPPIAWKSGFEHLGDAPTIVLANEFVDVFGPDQCIRTPEGWRWRAVTLDQAGRLQFTVSTARRPRDDLDRRWPGAPTGEIFDTLAVDDLAEGIATMTGGQPSAALLIDYGHEQPALGDTLQAVRNHAHEHALTSPGEANLTVDVDFADVARAMAARGFLVDGPLTQAEFLGRLGIMERASRLMAANPAKANAIEMGVARLMAPQGMGTRFKAMGVRSAGLPPLPGLAP